MASNKQEKDDLRQKLADELVRRIKAGTAPWQKPWAPGEVLAPINAVTGKEYRGVNYTNLMTFSPDPTDPRWCTVKQANSQGWRIRKGAHGLPIEKWSTYEHKRTPEEIEEIRKAVGPDKEIEPTEERLGVRYYTVFHASQIEGIPPLERKQDLPEIDGKPDERLPKLAEAMGVSLQYGGGRAFYRSSEDHVQMPPVEYFVTATGHDTTLLHELSHATGHESRLHRELDNPFGSQKYALEELRAEMSASMTAASLGIGFDPQSQNMEEGRTTENSAAYLASWLDALPEKDRKQAIMAAIKDAQAISDYLIERAPELERKAPEQIVAEKELAMQKYRESAEGMMPALQKLREEMEEKVRTIDVNDKTSGIEFLREFDRKANDIRGNDRKTGEHLPTKELYRVLGEKEADEVVSSSVQLFHDLDRERSRIYRELRDALGITGADLAEYEVTPEPSLRYPKNPNVEYVIVSDPDDHYFGFRFKNDMDYVTVLGSMRTMDPRPQEPLHLEMGVHRVRMAEREDLDKVRRLSIEPYINNLEEPLNRNIVRALDPNLSAELPESANRKELAKLVQERLEAYAWAAGRHVDQVQRIAQEWESGIQKEPLLTRVPAEVVPFLGGQQGEVTEGLLRHSEEREFFSDKMRELREIIRNMPETYQTDGMGDVDLPVSLRYFGPGNQQWYIIEKDRGDPENRDFRQTQAYGLAYLGTGFPEMGYINIEEITRLGAELDYHFTPTNLLEVKKSLSLVRDPNIADPEPSLPMSAESVQMPEPSPNAVLVARLPEGYRLEIDRLLPDGRIQGQIISGPEDRENRRSFTLDDDTAGPGALQSFAIPLHPEEPDGQRGIIQIAKGKNGLVQAEMTIRERNPNLDPLSPMFFSRTIGPSELRPVTEQMVHKTLFANVASHVQGDFALSEEVVRNAHILKPAEIRDGEFLPGETVHGYLQHVERGGWVLQMKMPDGRALPLVAGRVHDTDGLGKNGDYGKVSPVLDLLGNWERREVFVGALPNGEILADVSPDRLQENLRSRLEGKELPDSGRDLNPETLERVRTYARVLDSSTLDYVSYSGPDTAQLIQEWAAENPQRLERLAQDAAGMRDRASEYVQAVGLGAYQVTSLSQDIEHALRDRGVSLPPQGDLDPELVAHLEQRNRIRQGESLATGARGDDWPGGLPAGLGGDRVANAEAFIQIHAQQHPQQAKDWAQKLRAAPKEYGHAAGMSEDSIGLVAKQMEEGILRVQRGAALDPKEQAIIEYNRFYEQLPGNVDKLLQDIGERFAKVDMTDQKAFADAMTKTQIQADEVFGIIRKGPDRGMSRSELALEKADVDPGKRAELRHARWDAFEAQSNRYRDALDRAREQMVERLKERGKDVLRNPESASPQEVTAACLWKRGIPVSPQSEQIGKFVDAVEKKDLAKLLSSIGHNSQNPGSQEAFSRLTGVPLGKTEKERVAQIKNWVGEEKVVALEKAQKERALAQAEEAPRKELRRAADALSYVSVDLGARKVDGFQFVEQMAKEGFTEVHSRKRGAAVQRYLVNPETDKTTWLKSSRFQEFCKAVQAVEPSGDLLKAMEIAKIPLDVQARSPEKKSPDLPPAAGKELSSEDQKRVVGIQRAYENLRNISVRVTDPDGSTRVIEGRQYLEEKIVAGRTQVMARKEGAIVKRYIEDPKEHAFSGVRDKRFGEFLKRVEEFEPTKNVETAMARAGVERLSLAEVQKPALAVAGPEASVATKMEPDPQVAKAFVQRPEAEPTRTEGVGNGDRPKGLPLDIVLPQLPGGAENKVILASSPDVGGLSKINCRVLSVSHTGSSAQIEHAGKIKRLELSVNDLLVGARLPEGVRPQAVGEIAIGKDRQVRFTPKLERGKTLERQPENTGKQQALGI